MMILDFLTWYFIEVSGEILKGWKNFLLFNFEYFSIPILLKTYFSHWHRYYYSYGRGFDLMRYLEAFSFNSMSRIIGALLRTVLIFIGLMVEILISIIGLFILVLWIVLPVLLFIGLFFGFKLLL